MLSRVFITAILAIAAEASVAHTLSEAELITQIGDGQIQAPASSTSEAPSSTLDATASTLESLSSSTSAVESSSTSAVPGSAAASSSVAASGDVVYETAYVTAVSTTTTTYCPCATGTSAEDTVIQTFTTTDVSTSTTATCPESSPLSTLSTSAPFELVPTSAVPVSSVPTSSVAPTSSVSSEDTVYVTAYVTAVSTTSITTCLETTPVCSANASVPATEALSSSILGTLSTSAPYESVTESAPSSTLDATYSQSLPSGTLDATSLSAPLSSEDVTYLDTPLLLLTLDAYGSTSAYANGTTNGTTAADINYLGAGSQAKVFGGSLLLGAAAVLFL